MTANTDKLIFQKRRQIHNRKGAGMSDKSLISAYQETITCVSLPALIHPITDNKNLQEHIR